MRRLVLWKLALMAGVLMMGVPADAQDTAEDGTPYPQPTQAESDLDRKRIGTSLLRLLDSQESIPVIVTLVSQPAGEISEQEQERVAPRIREKEAEAMAIHRKYSTDVRPARPEDARGLAAQEASSYSQADKARVRTIAEEIKALKDEMRAKILERARQAVEADQGAVAGAVRGLGGSVTYSYFLQNSLAVRLPGRAIQALANHPLVRYVVEDQVAQADLNVSAPAISAGTFWNAGQTGGVWWNATMDTGVDTSHPDMGKTNGWWQTVQHGTAKNASNYNDNSASTDDFQGHGTHVAGIMNSSDTTYRGIAYGSTRSTNLKAGYRTSTGNGSMYQSDGMAAVQWGISNATIDVINLSFGSTDPMTVDDDDYTRFWDGLVHGQNIVLSKSAGNEGGVEETLTAPAGTYNGIVVANLNDQGTVTRADDTINSGSSRGPTPNGRKKPDIAAPGTSITAPNNAWEGTASDHVSKTGTSMAAPHIGGAATLLHDVGITDPRTVKAVLINTADFLPGQTNWNNSAGWGYVNLDRAYLRRSNYYLHSVTPRNTAGSYRLYKVPSPSIGDKATMTWHRRVNWNGSSYPTTYYGLSDLNLRFYRELTGGSHDSSLSGPDNVEQVVANTTDPLVIKAYAWSTSFSGVTSETYGLAVPPGTVTASGPVLSAGASSSSYSPPLNAKFRVLLRMSNSGDLGAHNCTINLSLPAGVSLVSGSLSTNAGTAAAGSATDYIEVWLKATTSGTKTVNVSGACSSYEVDWPVSGSSFTINPGAADTVAPYSVLNIPGVGYRSGGTELMANGGFESNWAGWVTTGTVALESSSPATGSRNAKLGPGSATAYQTVTISNSASRANLSFSYKSDAGFLASAGCRIRDAGGSSLVTAFSTSSNTSSWTTRTIDITRFKGQTVQIQFYSSGGIFGDSTLWIDDVSVKEGETLWLGSASTAVNILTADNAAGIDYSQFQVNSGSWAEYTAAFPMEQEGANTVYYRSVDNSGNVEPTITTSISLDSVAPASVLRVGAPRVFSGGTEKLTNPGFESLLAGWTATGSGTTTTSPVRTGSRAGKVGDGSGGTLSRDVAIGAGASRVIASAWVRATGVPNIFASYGASIVDPDTGQILDSGISGGTASILDWTQVVWDITRFKGKTVQIRFNAGAFLGSVPTLYVDDVSVRENANLYITPATTLRIGSFDSVGVDVFQSRIDAAAYVDGQTFSIPTPGLRTVYYRARDLMSKTETATTTQINVDSAGPTGSVNINAGAAFTTSKNVTLSISASDGAGVSRMRIRNSDGAFGAWQTYAGSKPWTLTDGAGTKTVVVQFEDGLGNLSGEYSDSIEYIPPVSTPIGDAKLFGPHPVAITLTDKRVSGVFAAQKMLYIQEANRSSGIKVNMGALSPAPSIGQFGTFEGIIQLDANNEAELYLTGYTLGSAAPAPVPVGLMNRELGGGPWGDYIPGITDGRGLHNVGLLVRTWGTVTAADGGAKTIRIDDGSGLPGGVLVDMSQAGALPSVGTMVQVTGNLGCVLDGPATRPIIRARSSADIAVP